MMTQFAVDDAIAAEDHRIGQLAAREWRRGFRWGAAAVALVEFTMHWLRLW